MGWQGLGHRSGLLSVTSFPFSSSSYISHGSHQQYSFFAQSQRILKPAKLTARIEPSAKEAITPKSRAIAQVAGKGFSQTPLVWVSDRFCNIDVPG